ncbi:FAD:protein FMN transferase [Streptomyces violaceus]|uniref:FAD:protein FMN transferase n=1 Tax=Streptomyces violaceus TaxID=1936 RepID=UPI00380526E4
MAVQRVAFDAIGTRWRIETDEPLAEGVRADVLERIRRFDATYSRFRPESLVSRIAAAPHGGRFGFPDGSLALFDLYDRLAAATSGAVDPLVVRDLELLGYDSAYSLTPAPAAVRAEEDARGRATWAADVVRDGTLVLTRRPLVIDVGAAGKGCLVDLVADVLRGAGIERFVVDGGGDLRHQGGPTVRVGLEHPFDPRLVIGVVGLRDRALCASAVNRRAWGEGLHHVCSRAVGKQDDQHNRRSKTSHVSPAREDRDRDAARSFRLRGRRRLLRRGRGPGRGGRASGPGPGLAVPVGVAGIPATPTARTARQGRTGDCPPAST